ncbi:MAG: hypothetical protein LLG13_01140 [Bacteroidales bacterium]|nr:hypothetical protein [Bacteroidales bacterium]
MLENRKVLFLTPEFYNYPGLIKQTLEKMGALVDLLYNRPTDRISKLIQTFFAGAYENTKQRYFNKLARRLGAEYDFILIIRADLIPMTFLQYLKLSYPGARFIQYVWDDINLFPRLLDTFKYFDKILSYNFDDCQKFGLYFRPFFFIERKNANENNLPVNKEVFFIGAYHTDRLKIIENIIRLNPYINLHSHFYINPITAILARIPVRKLHFFKFRKMKYSEMLDVIEKSAAVIDIQNISQHGLTTRVFEALGAGIKIITVNENIIKYDFYEKENILLINRDNPVIEESWLDLPYKHYDESTIQNYHIENWAADVFEFRNKNENKI